MALTNEQLVQQMYIAYYQRPADPDGLAYWVDQIETNGSWEAVAGAFGAPENEEYQGLYGDKTRAELIAELYLSAFGRAAVAEEVAYWEASEHSDQNLAFAIINGAQNDDRAVIDNKLAFAEALAEAVADNAAYLALGDVNAALAAVDADTDVAEAVADLVSGASELSKALAALKAATDAQAAFETEVGDEAELEAAIATAAANVESVLTVAGADAYAEAAPAVQAALVGEQQTVNAATLTTAQNRVAEANAEIEEVAGLKQAIAKLQAATVAVANAEEPVEVAEANLAGALATYNARNETALVEIVVEAGVIDADSIDIEVFAVENGKLSLVNGVTEATNPGVTAVLNSVNELVAATTTQAIAEETLETAWANVERLEDADGGTPLYDELVAANEGVVGAQGAIDSLAQLVAAQQQAEADLATFEQLEADVDEALAYFEENNLEQPVTLSGASIATAETDIFVATADSDGATISGFGFLGDDVLYIGSDFTLNAGGLNAGDASVLEVFFVQNGINTDVVLETQAYGSNEASVAETVITLTGVSAADLTLTEDGFVAVA